MRLDDIFLAGIGVYLPPVVSTTEAVERGWYDPAEAAESGWTGAAVAGDVPAPEMAASAARQALARSPHHGGDMTVVMHACTTHQGPDGWPAQNYVQRHAAAGAAFAVEIRQNCNGMLGAMELSSCFLLATGGAAALVSGADNFGIKLVDRWRYASGAGTNRASIMGDAGAAVVLSRRSGFARLLAINSFSLPVLEEMYRSGIPLFPPEPTLGRPANLGQRLGHFLRTNPSGAATLRTELSEARTSLAEQTLAEAGISAAQVTRATHVFSGGERYIKSVLAPLGIPTERGMLDLGREVGHLGTCDHIVALDHLLSTGGLGGGDHVLMLSNGGASLACAVVEIVECPQW
jgi:3-oxoacyl-[acyl-carrier-protein] synthase III